MKITKRHIAALEKIFDAEIRGRIPFQSRAKIYSEMEGMGLVERGKRVLGRDRFGAIEVEGWFLTHAGRYEYCRYADQFELAVPTPEPGKGEKG